jgi:RNA polymerase sigma-54 factor
MAANGTISSSLNATRPGDTSRPSPDDDRARLARAVISRHLPDLARGHLALIATALGMSRSEIQQVLDLIRRRLRPYPAFDANTAEIAYYVVPDVVVREHDVIRGEFTAELVEPALTRLGVGRAQRRRGASTERDSAPEELQQARSRAGPISDQHLADLLRDAGYPIARRTVAKHRARLGLTDAPMR